MDTGVRTATIVPNSRWNVFRSATRAPHATTPATTANSEAMTSPPMARCSRRTQNQAIGAPSTTPAPTAVSTTDRCHAQSNGTTPSMGARPPRPCPVTRPHTTVARPVSATTETQRPESWRAVVAGASAARGDRANRTAIASKVAAIPATTVAASPMCVAISRSPDRSSQDGVRRIGARSPADRDVDAEQDHDDDQSVLRDADHEAPSEPLQVLRRGAPGSGRGRPSPAPR